MRGVILLVIALALAGCHTTSLGQSIGYPAPETPPSSERSWQR